VFFPAISVRLVGAGAWVPVAVASTVVTGVAVVVGPLSVMYSAAGKSAPMVSSTVSGATASEAVAVSCSRSASMCAASEAPAP
jgi:hypothetical protein